MSNCFMGDYYDHYYEDPYLAAYSMSEEYPEIHKEYIQKSTAFVEALGGFGSPLWKQYEELSGLLLHQATILARESYILGTKDMSRFMTDLLVNR